MTFDGTMAADAHFQPAETGISGRVILITGAAQGIGRELALECSQAGAIPVITDLNGEGARRVANEIATHGNDALALALDVSDELSAGETVAAVMAKYGRVDVLINNAAVFSGLTMKPFHEIGVDEWEDLMRVNVTGCFIMAKTVIGAMKAAGWGRVINMSSSAVQLGLPNYLHYVTSKAALVGMTNAMAREVGAYGITVNAVQPGAVTTEVQRSTVTPQIMSKIVESQCIPRPQTPPDLVGLVQFLASPAADFITGQTIACNGGHTHR